MQQTAIPRAGQFEHKHQFLPWGMGKCNIRAHRTFRAEQLEERQLMTADISFDADDNILYIHGTNQADEITVEYAPDGLYASVVTDDA